ncbi:hypothetical protein [Thioalkalivibrio thiocyanoxidans]|uniref:hypothetical protein n=1 Tax=Thioalkalivibrio thiocyanoxidans TaxID=152475 RepID=UPI000375FCC5|nr:hypothetical protein [Thioalkalivibrio thiocyanoxidans]
MKAPILIDLPTEKLERYLDKRDPATKARFFMDGLLLPRGVRRGQWHRRTKPFDQHPIYGLLEHLLNEGRSRDEHINALRYYYRERGKTVDQAEDKIARSLDKYLERYRGLARSMAENGYVAGLGKDEIGVAIGPEGEFIKVANGNHRLAVARLTGVSQVVGEIQFVHREWLRRQPSGRDVDQTILHTLRSLNARRQNTDS